MVAAKGREKKEKNVEMKLSQEKKLYLQSAIDVLAI